LFFSESNLEKRLKQHWDITIVTKETPVVTFVIGVDISDKISFCSFNLEVIWKIILQGNS
jgi:hypothetical protein